MVAGKDYALASDTCDDCAATERQTDRDRRDRDELQRRNIPSRYREATFDSFAPQTTAQQAALAAAEAFNASAASGLLLTGPAGCGKTHLAAAIVADGPVGSFFVNVSELLDDIKTGFHGEDSGLFDRALRTPLLVLDDIGAEKTTDWVRDRFYRLLDKRWANVMRTIVTTNLLPGELATRIGESNASRVIGICSRLLSIDGPDHRLVNHKPTAS